MPVSTAPSHESLALALKPHVPPGYGVVLFGSRARGGSLPASDWDLGVLGEQPLPGDVMERLREALEALPTLHSFDVVDLAAVPGAFRAVALQGARRIL